MVRLFVFFWMLLKEANAKGCRDAHSSVVVANMAKMVICFANDCRESPVDASNTP